MQNILKHQDKLRRVSKKPPQITLRLQHISKQIKPILGNSGPIYEMMEKINNIQVAEVSALNKVGQLRSFKSPTEEDFN